MKRGRHAQATKFNIKPVLVVVLVLIVAAIAVLLLLRGGEHKDDTDDIPDEPPVIENEVPEEDTKKPEPEPEKDSEPEHEPEPEPEPEPEAYTGPVNPLTGLPVDTNISLLRPYAVMINNVKVATPQCGVSKADIIYETLAEGGITRLVAIYQDFSDVEIIGSVRSARPYFIDIAQSHDAIYIHAGGSNDAYYELKNRGIDNIDGVNGSGETFFRDSWRRNNMGYEHSLMLDTSLVSGYIEKHSFDTMRDSGYVSSMVFTDEPAAGDVTAENVKVRYSSSKTTSFTYDAENAVYKVSQHGGAMTDSADGSQVRVKNIIVMNADITRIAGDDAGRMKATLTGSGSGYFICNGMCAEITWHRDSKTSEFVYKHADGSVIEFGRGSTFVSIIPKDGGDVEIS